MVEKILETATSNAKELQLNLENINLIVFIKSIIEKHQDISKKQITFEFEKEELYIRADSFYLENAISNLILRKKNLGSWLKAKKYTTIRQPKINNMVETTLKSIVFKRIKPL